MAFAKGAFEGYNDMRDAEKDHESNMALQRLVNSGKTQVEADPMFTVLGDKQTYTFFTLPDASAGTEKERSEKWLDSFYTDPLLKNKEWMDSLKTTDASAYDQIMAAHDGGSKSWLDKHAKTGGKNGDIYHFLTGNAYARNQGHWLESRFDNIALGNAAKLSDDQIFNIYNAKNGKFIEKEQYSPAKYGFENIQVYRAEMANLSFKKGGYYNDKMNHFSSAYDHRDIKAYSMAMPIMDILLEDNFSLSGEQNKQLSDILISFGSDGTDKYRVKTSYGEERWNVDKLHRFFTLAAQPVHRERVGKDQYYFIDKMDEYTKRVLGFDKGIEGLRAKGRSVDESVQTIRSVRSLIRTDQEEGEVALFGIPAKLRVLGESLGGEGGFVDQMMSMITRSGAQFGNDDGTLGTREQMAAKLKARLASNSGTAGTIARREVLMELLAYQLAAAIQGGTGGRTISDQDVVNIKRALGASLFTSGELQLDRLAQLESMMLDMSELTNTYTRSRSIEELKAADLTTQFLLKGRNLKSMGVEYVVNILGNLNSVPEDKQSIEQRKSENPQIYATIFGKNYLTLEEFKDSPDGKSWVNKNPDKDFDAKFGPNFIALTPAEKPEGETQ